MHTHKDESNTSASYNLTRRRACEPPWLVTRDPAVTTFAAPASSQPLPLSPLLSADELLPLASNVTTTPASSLLLCLLPWSLLPASPGPPAATRACAALNRPDWYLCSHRHSHNQPQETVRSKSKR